MCIWSSRPNYSYWIMYLFSFYLHSWHYGSVTKTHITAIYFISYCILYVFYFYNFHKHFENILYYITCVAPLWSVGVQNRGRRAFLVRSVAADAATEHCRWSFGGVRAVGGRRAVYLSVATMVSVIVCLCYRPSLFAPVV